MAVLDYINRLLGRPSLLDNGYPNMARNHQYEYDDEIIRDVTRRNNGGFYIPMPPPPVVPLVEEKPEPPMVSEIVDSLQKKLTPTIKTPSTTSTLSEDYTNRLCGSTIHQSSEIIKEKEDPLVLDHIPLKNFLIKRYKWILDVTEVRIRPRSASSRMISKGTIVYGPVEIHITVSPIHYSELMSPKIEKKVRDNLYQDLIPLITCMFENNNKDKPIIIFSPSHSETILEYVK